MAYTLDYGINLGTTKTGLTLNAQIIDSVGAATGAAITTGFVEVGSGSYLLHCTTIPDDHRGAIYVYESGAPSVVLALTAINPEEAEDVGGSCNYPPSPPAALGLAEDLFDVNTTEDVRRLQVTEPDLDLDISDPTVRVSVTDDEAELDAGC